MFLSSEETQVSGQPQGMRLFNDRNPASSNHNDAHATASFYPFSRLPPELRLSIWNHILQQNRLISLVVVDTTNDPPYIDDPERGTIQTSYKIQTATHHVPTALLQVNHESRLAALKFYRVSIPYNSRDPTGHQIHFNPEFDFIHLQMETGPPERLANFIHDFKSNDPKKTGILNLGIGASTPQKLCLPSYPSKIPPKVLTSFKSTLTNLQNVFFRHIARWDSRLMFDSLSMASVRFNRSYPITSTSESFSLFAQDPRSISLDMDKIAIGWDPRHMYYLWNEMDKNFSISRTSGSTQFHYHISTPLFGEHPEVCTRDEAVKELKRENESWRGRWEKGALFQSAGYEDPDTEERLRNAPLPVFGFWVVPLGSFGKDDKVGSGEWDMKVVVDWSKLEPQLAVFNLGGG